ncbi:MAG: stage II sporulation protein R [Dethiobacteria bacterium]|jgi:stage II sporulation protein R
MIKAKPVVIIILCMLFALIFWGNSGRMPRPVEKDARFMRENYIRFHVLAHSDAPWDQQQKNELKDYLLEEYLFSLMRAAKTKKEALELLERKRNEIEEGAAAYLNSKDYNLPVKVEIGTHPFPIRRYGNEIYPAGEYTALRVLIGDASGENWWCVIFPPLCFPLATPSEAEAQVSSEVVSAEKEAEEKNSSPRIYWKVVEWLRMLFFN